MAEELLTRLENGVLWLTINRADKGNAIPYYVRDALIDAFRNAHWDLDVRARRADRRGRAALLHRRRPLGAAAAARHASPPDAPERVVGAAINMMRARLPAR